MSTDAHTLTGAYVLDAVSEVERRAFEHHLTDCPSCAQEVLELRETTVRLGSATFAAPPPRIWDRVGSAIKTTRQLPASPRRRRWPRIAVAVSAAGVVAAVALHAQSTSLEHQLATAHNQFGQITAILAAPDAELASQSGPGGRAATMVMSRSANGMVLLTHGLPALPLGHSVQAWFVTQDGQKTSAGLLDPANGSLLVAGLAAASNAASLTLTVEPRGGSTRPSGKTVLAVPMAG